MQSNMANATELKDLLLYTMPVEALRQVLVEKSTELLQALPEHAKDPHRVARLNSTVQELQRIMSERQTPKTN